MRERLTDLVLSLRDLAADPGLREVIAGVAEGVSLATSAVGEQSDAALGRVTKGFGLSPFDRDLLLLAGLAEEHDAIAHLYAGYHPRGEARPTAAVCARALQLRPRDVWRLREAVEVGPLVRHGLLIVDGDDPLPARGLRVLPGLWASCAGATHWPLGVPLVEVAESSLVEDRLAALVARLDATSRRLVGVVGATWTEEDVAAQVVGALTAAGREPVVVSADTAAALPAATSAHAVALDRVPVVVGTGAAPPLPHHPGPIVVCATRLEGLGSTTRDVSTVMLPRRSVDDEARSWAALLPELATDAGLLAGSLRLGPAGAARVVADVRRAAADGIGVVDVAAVRRSARLRADTELPGAVRLVQPRATLDDLVMPARQRSLLEACIDRVRHQRTVLDEWGFGDAVRAGRGARLMLSGPPGTGKSLAAEVIASALGLDLLVVDLAALVSKWLGETEKHISQVFDAAERTQSVLLFDEADAIFGRRTTGGDPQSRWANVETAHVLARTEAFDGLLVLTTNLRSAVDEAFTRRLDAVVETEEPGPEQRLDLWRLHLPADAPVAEDVELAVLADRYDTTGAVIRNAALAAAFAAASLDGQITTELLVEAVRREYVKSGRSFPVRPGSAPDHSPPPRQP